jgi:hypothetical protein
LIAYKDRLSREIVKPEREGESQAGWPAGEAGRAKDLPRIRCASIVLLLAVYGVRPAFPVVVFAALIAMGVGWLGSALDRVQAFEKWARVATGLVFVGVGIFETLRSTLYLI